MNTIVFNRYDKLARKLLKEIHKDYGHFVEIRMSTSIILLDMPHTHYDKFRSFTQEVLKEDFHLLPVFSYKEDYSTVERLKNFIKELKKHKVIFNDFNTYIAE